MNTEHVCSLFFRLEICDTNIIMYMYDEERSANGRIRLYVQMQTSYNYINAAYLDVDFTYSNTMNRDFGISVH